MAQHPLSPLGDNDLIFCDFDGTISEKDTGIAVIDALNLEEAWEIEHIWRRGDIDSMTCLARQWGMVKLKPSELLALIDSFALRTDFPTFFDFVRFRQAYLVVVSDGLDFYVDRMLARLGFATCDGDMVLARQYDCIPRYANHARLTEQGVLVEFPHRTPVCAQCGNCKLAHLFRLRPHFRRVIYIGDGHSDMCPARYADVLFARDHLAADAAANGIPFHPFVSFGDIIAALS